MGQRWTWNRVVIFLVAPWLVAYGSAAAVAQQVLVTTPAIRTNEGFFERFGVGWELSGPNFFFNWGAGINSALPPFGGHNPNDDFRFGIGGRSGSTRFGFNFAAGQGSDRSIIGVAPSVMVPNGFGGSISDTSVRPFVTGLIPVVGNQPRMVPQYTTGLRQSLARLKQNPQLSLSGKNRSAKEIADARRAQSGGGGGAPLSSRRSSASQGALSLAEIRSQQSSRSSESDGKIQRLLRKAADADDRGKRSLAKLYYRQALSDAKGPIRQTIIDKLKALK